MAKTVKFSKTATIKKKGVVFNEMNNDTAYLMEFEPGLPYDKRTKGVPHKRAIVFKTVIQDMDYNAHGQTYFIFCSDRYAKISKGKLAIKSNINYIHQLIKAKDLKEALKKLEYKLVDEVEEKKNHLIQSAKNKLTKEEIEAIGLK